MTPDLARDFAALAECLRLVAGGLERMAASAAQPAPLPPAAPPATPDPPPAAPDKRPSADTRATAEGPRWTAERIALLTARLTGSNTKRPSWNVLSAELSALPGPFVSFQHARDWWAKVGAARAARAAAPVPPAAEPAPTIEATSPADASPPEPAPEPAPPAPQATPPATPRAAPPPVARTRLVRLPTAEDEARQAAADALVCRADSEVIRSWGKAHGVPLLDRGRLGALAVQQVNAVRKQHGLPPFVLVSAPIGVIPAAELDRMRNAADVGATSRTGYDAGAPAQR